MKLEVESSMKAESSVLLPVEVRSDGHESAVTEVAWTAGRRSRAKAEQWWNPGGPKAFDALDDDEEIAGTTSESNMGP
jgi:hypothetical protein